MKIRFQADADLNQAIVTGIVRREPTLDFQTSNVSNLTGLSDIGGDMNPHNLETQFVVCINDRDDRASLEVRKIYQTIPDDRAAEHRSSWADRIWQSPGRDC